MHVAFVQWQWLSGRSIWQIPISSAPGHAAAQSALFLQATSARLQNIRISSVSSLNNLEKLSLVMMKKRQPCFGRIFIRTCTFKLACCNTRGLNCDALFHTRGYSWITGTTSANYHPFSALKCSMSGFGLVYLLFNVTFNDISVIYVTAHRCAGWWRKKLDLRSGSHAIDIS